MYVLYCVICYHYVDVIMSAMASQITSITIVNSTVYLGGDQIRHQSSASLAFVWGSHRGPVNYRTIASTRKMFPLDDVIMRCVWDGWSHLISHGYGSCGNPAWQSLLTCREYISGAFKITPHAIYIKGCRLSDL